MVFHIRCLSFFVQEDEEETSRYKTATQAKLASTLTPTQPFDTAPSNFNPSVTNSQPNLSLSSNNLKEFTFSELEAATNNFSGSTKLGEGGFGCVYMGVINDPRDSTKTLDVAVKQLNQSGLQGHKEWVTEVNVLGVVEHPNLVKLVGYCAEDDERGIQRLLVYEYMPNRSVRDHLSRRSEAPLSWTMRLKVAQDTARGLAYLNEETGFQIIFRDFKSSNILLDSQCNAKLSDFGLARRGPEEGLTHVSTAAAGTVGYMAPECIELGRVTPTSDVWSYGVFLYELITGRRPLDTIEPKNEQRLLEWVKPYVDSKNFQQVIDPRLEDNYSLITIQKLCVIADRCLRRNPKSRPKMSEVVKALNQVINEVPSQAIPLNGRVSESAEIQQEGYETTTQTKSTSTQTFYTAFSDINHSVPEKVSSVISNLVQKSSDLQVFTFADLKEATMEFDEASVVGEGGLGLVYRGVIKSFDHYPFDEIEVAVKDAIRALQEPKEWLGELGYYGVVEHPNLVKFIGHCFEEIEGRTRRLLVYEYMSNKSVEYHLSTRSKTPLSWTMRLKVAQDVAHGMAYLHENPFIQIICGDLKSSNILLDAQWKAKISNFGMARLGPEEGLAHVSTMVAATTGYTDPEYIKTGHLSPTSDVWSYGVFLYELITGRSPLDHSRPKKEQDLVKWVKPYIGSKRIELIMDPRLELNYSPESAQKLSRIAHKCVSRNLKSRPKMSEVVEMVDRLLEVPSGLTDPPKSRVGAAVVKLKNVCICNTKV
ncbi:hypothetical protein OSB04_014052 [Centaurea solstitialis]|uniref:non-specific serine/threonine protein kinase n=1 Tax=Centaurea solstitialis TaxID=347529 RepID=A0AA38TEE0_9ASTR|nr:hypothetical protein OSB04_014052 [Centaurea solstitialis]